MWTSTARACRSSRSSASRTCEAPRRPASYLRKLRDILVYLEICDGNMEEGRFRCDANVSIRPKGEAAFGTRAELKNMNSFRNVQRALEYEIKRQQYILESGGEVIQETRLWDDAQGHDPLHAQQGGSPRLPLFPRPGPRAHHDLERAGSRRSAGRSPSCRWPNRSALSGSTASRSMTRACSRPTRALADFYEETVKLCGKPKIVSNWVMGDLLRYLNEQKRDIKESPVSPDHVAQMINLIEDGTISGKIAKEVFEEMYKTGEEAHRHRQGEGPHPDHRRGGRCKGHRGGHGEKPDAARRVPGRQGEALWLLRGPGDEATKGKANPQLVNDLLKKMLSGS